MQKRAVWTGTLAGMVAGAGSRVLGFVFGKAIAFTYAVIVSVVANVVFDLVRNPPPVGSTDPITVAAARRTADDVVARAPLPASPAADATVLGPVQTPAVAASEAPPTAENPRPGPGSGGLY
jgi:hypothetical protein